jgi:SAM-dependent methyltransferase
METEKTVAERPCPITGGRDCQVVATRAREGHALRNVISMDSGLIYVDPLPIEDLSQFYKEDYRKAYKNVAIPKKKHIIRAGGVALKRWEQLKDFLPRGIKAVDFGAGGGEWAYLLKSRGVEIFGIEPNQGYGGFAREHYGLNLFLGMYQEANLEKGAYEVATLFHVLEHLKDPVDDIRNLSAFLKDGGYFAIEVPDILHAAMRFDHKWHDGHLFGFDIKTLAGVVNSAGLHTVKLEKQGGNLFGIFQKREGEKVVQPDLRGHSKEALQEMAEGRRKYWFFPNTYLKIFCKAGRAIKEKILVSSKKDGRGILDSLYRNEA